MTPAEVPSEWVEKVEASLRNDGAYSDDVAREWVARHALAAVMPEIQAQALRDAADDEDRLTRERYGNVSAVSRWGAIARAKAARLTTTEGEAQ